MKIIGIVASPHGVRGNTGRLMMKVLEAAQEQSATVETVALPGGTVLPCKACDMCHKKGFCPQKDEFENIIEKIMGSECVVLASPNYIFTVSAQMKAFMDRCGGVIHRMAFEGKYGASVVTSGGGDEEPIAEFMNHFMLTTGMTPVGSVWATMGTITGDDFPEDICQKAADLGRKLIRDCENSVSSPEIDERKARFAERMRNLMLYRKDDWPAEYEYWKKHRGL